MVFCIDTSTLEKGHQSYLHQVPLPASKLEQQKSGGAQDYTMTNKGVPEYNASLEVKEKTLRKLDLMHLKKPGHHVQYKDDKLAAVYELSMLQMADFRESINVRVRQKFF